MLATARPLPRGRVVCRLGARLMVQSFGRRHIAAAQRGSVHLQPSRVRGYICRLAVCARDGDRVLLRASIRVRDTDSSRQLSVLCPSLRTESVLSVSEVCAQDSRRAGEWNGIFLYFDPRNS